MHVNSKLHVTEYPTQLCCYMLSLYGWPGHLRLPKHPSRPKVKHSEEVWGDSVETTASQVLLIWSATFEMWFPTGCCPNAEDYKERLTGFVFGRICGWKSFIMSRQVANCSLLPFMWHRWVIDTPPQKWKLPICKKAWISTISLLTLLLPFVSSAFFEVSGSNNSFLPDMSRFGIASLDVVP